MNRLAAESSLYLRQHASNPVDWHPWGDEAIARAKELAKKSGLGQVRVQGENGEFESEWTYGKDPRRSPG